MGKMESLKFLVSSRYIGDLATLVVAYGISISPVEVSWKSKLRAQFPSLNEYSFMGDLSTATGITTFTMMLLSQFIFDKYGWGVAATITPTVLLLTGVGFFLLILFGDPLDQLAQSLAFLQLYMWVPCKTFSARVRSTVYLILAKKRLYSFGQGHQG